MKTLILILIYLLFSTMVFAQTEKPKIKIYNIKVTLLNNKKAIKGTFYAVQDSSITIVDSYIKDNIQHVKYTSIPIQDIKVIKIRRSGKTGSSMVIGAVTGLGVAVTIGLLAGPDDCLKTDWCQDVGEKIKMYGFLFVPIGTLIGAIVGSQSKKFDIYGAMKNYVNNKTNLMDYTTFKNDLSFETRQLY